MRPLLLAWSVTVAFAVPPLAAQQPIAADMVSAVDRVFADYAEGAVPGCAVGVSAEGELALSRAYGLAELEHGAPNTLTTRFEAGSVSKQFTAAAVVLLSLEGRLDLDDDVRTYVPELPDYGTPITVRHLLNHTSGLRDWGTVAAIHGWARTTRAHDHDHVLDIITRQQELNYPPGAYYSYTNSGYNLLAMLVERVTGTPFAEFSREHVFDPLGLEHTEWRDDFRRLVPERATAYAPIDGGGFRLDMPFEHVHGNGGLVTTVEDLLTWTRHLELGTLGGDAFVAEMHRQGVLTSGREIAYASGLVARRYREVPEVQHGGATAGYRAFLTRFPDQGVAVALLCNRADANPGALAHQVADLFLDGQPDVAAAEASAGGRAEAIALDARLVAELEGHYRDTRTQGLVRVTAREGGLVAGSTPFEPIDTETRPAKFRVGSYEVVVLPNPGARPALLRIDPAGDSIRAEPVEPFDPTPTELASYEGRYHSPEAEVTYRVELRDDRLVMVDRYGDARVLTPLYPDGFARAGGIVRFTRGPGGRVLTFQWSAGRVWNLTFRREG